MAEKAATPEFLMVQLAELQKTVDAYVRTFSGLGDSVSEMTAVLTPIAQKFTELEARIEALEARKVP